MSKIDIIEDCIDCSKLRYGGRQWFCSETGNVVYTKNGIPSSCPLPDFTEPGVEADAESRCLFCKKVAASTFNFCHYCSRNLRTA